MRREEQACALNAADNQGRAVVPPVRAGVPPHLRFGAGVRALARGANGRRPGHASWMWPTPCAAWPWSVAAGDKVARRLAHSQGTRPWGWPGGEGPPWKPPRTPALRARALSAQNRTPAPAAHCRCGAGGCWVFDTASRRRSVTPTTLASHSGDAPWRCLPKSIWLRSSDADVMARPRTSVKRRLRRGGEGGARRRPSPKEETAMSEGHVPRLSSPGVIIPPAPEGGHYRRSFGIGDFLPRLSAH